MITQLAPNEIFVFSSNLAGRHGAGAARQAHKQFGAQMGCGEGITGSCYAFPTLDETLRQLPIHRIEQAREALFSECRSRPTLRFLLTKVGCGLAGYPEEQMSVLFTNPPANLILPEDWKSQHDERLVQQSNHNKEMENTDEK